MIKDNQKRLNHFHVVLDACVIACAYALAWFIVNGTSWFNVTGHNKSAMAVVYLAAGVLIVPFYLILYAFFHLYTPKRVQGRRVELANIFKANIIGLLVISLMLYLGGKNEYFHNFSRPMVFLFFGINLFAEILMRNILRIALRSMRSKGYNQKHVLIVGGGETALQYLKEIQRDRELGYHPVGYIADHTTKQMAGLRCLGSYDHLEKVLERQKPDEVISAIGVEDYHRMPQIISACEKTGSKLSIIPFYADYMPSNPQFDSLNGIPLMNLRRIPLDNWGNAFCKRAMDIVGSALLLILTSPVMLFCAAGVRLSSPGPVFFRQKRIGRSKRPFYMYKFRSMRVNDEQDTGWSGQTDSRKTRFGAFLRKCSLDEFPQFWNVLKGDMSLVGPRPEVPYYVEQFKEEVPLYMVKHQVRPGITGWAQVNGLRGDTSIKARIEHDVYYIEHWSLGFDLKILWMTLFKGKFLNDESLSGSAPGR